MATSMFDFLNYDLSNTDLADAVKHARQTKANKAKWTNVVSQVKEWGHWWSQDDDEDIEYIYIIYTPEDFGLHLGSETLAELIRNANEHIR